MTIIRWSPFRNIAEVQSEMNHLFEEMMRRREGETEGGVWLPSMDISETTDNVLVNVEIPGVAKDDISLTINNNILTLKGTKKVEREVGEENFHRMERTFGTFYRAVELPVLVQSDSIEASFSNGVLEIVLPKAEEAKPKEIAIDIIE